MGGIIFILLLLVIYLVLALTIGKELLYDGITLRPMYQRIFLAPAYLLSLALYASREKSINVSRQSSSERLRSREDEMYTKHKLADLKMKIEHMLSASIRESSRISDLNILVEEQLLAFFEDNERSKSIIKALVDNPDFLNIAISGDVPAPQIEAIMEHYLKRNPLQFPSPVFREKEVKKILMSGMIRQLLETELGDVSFFNSNLGTIKKLVEEREQKVDKDITAIKESLVEIKNSKAELHLDDFVSNEEYIHLKSELEELRGTLFKLRHQQRKDERKESSSKQGKPSQSARKKELIFSHSPESVGLDRRNYSEIHYSPRPQGELFYERSFKPDVVKSKTFYEIRLDSDSGRGVFFLVGGHPETLKAAWNYRSVNIIPAMDIVGDGQVGDSPAIKHQDYGKLVKEGNTWKIVEKGKVEFE